MSKVRVVTVNELRKLDVCEEEVERFEKVFGSSAKVTKANCFRAVKEGFDVEWYVNRVLEAPALEAYKKAKALTFWEVVHQVGKEEVR